MARQDAGHSDPTPSIARALARLVLIVGGILAIWFVLPASASAAEEILGSTADETGTDAVDGTADASVDPLGVEAAPAPLPDPDATIASVEALVNDAVSAIDITGTLHDVTAAGANVVSRVGVGPRGMDITAPVLDPLEPLVPPIADEPDPEPSPKRASDRVPSHAVIPTASARGGNVPTTSRSEARSSTTSDPTGDRARVDDGDRGGSTSDTAGLLAAGAIARGGSRIPIDDLAAIIFLSTVLLCLGRWSRFETGFRPIPVFRSLAGPPG